MNLSGFILSLMMINAMKSKLDILLRVAMISYCMLMVGYIGNLYYSKDKALIFMGVFFCLIAFFFMCVYGIILYLSTMMSEPAFQSVQNRAT